MNRVLLFFLIRRSRTGAILTAAGLLAFECFLAAIFAWARPDRTMSRVMEIIPARLRGLFGNDALGIATQSGFLAMGFVHPLALLLSGALAILNGTRLAGDIESRAIDLLLSQPIGRGSLIATHAALGVISSALAAGAALAGHRLGVAIFTLPEPVPVLPFFFVSVNFALFVLATHALALLTGSASSRRAVAVGASVGVLALMLFLRLAAQLWDAFRIPGQASLFTYYLPGQVVARGTLAAADVVALLSFAAAAYAAATVIFLKRDIA